MHNLDTMLTNTKLKWWKHRLFAAFNILLASIAIGLLAKTLLSLSTISMFNNAEILFFSFIILVLFLAFQKFSKQYASLNHNNLLAHIDRTYSETEESARLLFVSESQLSTLQLLQRKRIKRNLNQANIDVCDALSPLYKISKGMMGLGGSLMLACTLLYIVNNQITNTDIYLPKVESNGEASLSIVNDIQWRILISPPEYTQLPKREVVDFNFQAVQGSNIKWIASSYSNPRLFLDISQQATQAFVEIDANTFQAELTLTTPTIYSINQSIGSDTKEPSFHTINMLKDKPPVIRINSPESTVTEFKRSETPIVDAEVIVEDDYGLSKVFIKASIAKGSGESVKFRDQEFEFDSLEELSTNSSSKTKRRYQKRWDFIALNMEPGDELYFTVSATDNRSDLPQNTVSQTKILKWLDDEDIGISSDGILMDFIPEYFKSQRQIIIETSELIDKKTMMSPEEFDETSRDLGIAQSDLKLRYGQYLGDEFETGVMQSMEAGPNISLNLSSDEHDDEASDEEGLEEHDHTHGHDEAQSDVSEISTHSHEHDTSNGVSSLSGYDEIIELFGHNHGSAETEYVGPKSGQLNPRALMKLSIQNMWQAELYLHLSDPVNALPYEQEALDYLNRARKADRVYVKRLGFKPPPVTEDRRYKGELNDILEPKLRQNFEVDNTEENIIRQLLSRLTKINPKSSILNEDDKDLLTQSIAILNNKLDTLPNTSEALSVLAALERIRAEKKWVTRACADCLAKVKAYFWQSLRQPIAEPQLKPLNLENDIVKNFKQVMQQQ